MKKASLGAPWPRTFRRQAGQAEVLSARSTTRAQAGKRGRRRLRGAARSEPHPLIV
jgi:hypothetical protein